MGFIELLEKYKNGETNEDESKLVEEEIQKCEVISDYLAEKYDIKNLKLDVANPTVDNTKSIKRTINRKLAQIVTISVGLVFAILFVINFILSPIVSSIYYNPTNKTVGQKHHDDLYYDLKAITEVSFPGYQIQSANSESLGFGKYNIHFSRTDLFTKDLTSVNASIKKDIRVGTIEDFYPINIGVFTGLWSAEKDSKQYKEYSEFETNIIKHLNSYIKELPKTSYLSTYVLFENELSLKEFTEMAKKYGVEFQWVSFKTDEHINDKIMGFSTEMNGTIATDLANPKRYPALQLPDASNLIPWSQNYYAEAYEMHALSLLKYLSERKNATKALVGNGNKFDYNSAYEYVKKNGISIRGALIYSEIDSLIYFLENESIIEVYIDNILPSVYSRKK